MTLLTNLDSAAASAGMSHGHTVSIASFLRPADVVAYAAGDVVSGWTVALPDPDGEAEHAIEFPRTGPSGAVLNVALYYNETDTVDFRLYVFDAEPTNFADNVAFVPVAADLPKHVATFNFLDANKETMATGLNHYVAYGPLGEALGLPIAFTSASNSLFGILTTESIFTPVSAAKVILKMQMAHD